MKWLVPVVAIQIVGFYVRFLWAISKELKPLFRKPPTCRTRQPVFRHRLFRLDPAKLWTEKLDCDTSRIEDQS